VGFREIIECKKRGESLTAEQITWLVESFTNDQLPDYQMSAFLMAVWFRGLTPAETLALTDSMLKSGAMLDMSRLAGPTADKHSTGGVGDKVSLLLAPLVAACGVQVPMLSGRGLGHTAGTLDKLEAIPGYQVLLPNHRFLEVVEEVGCAIVGQSPDIAPADGKVYALRDVTGTVDCVPLITASILSKKLAAGPANIVIDLKTGSGAFMADLAQAHELARSLIATASHWGRRLAVVFSDMSQPLGRAVGHAHETREAFAALQPGGRSRAPADLVGLTSELAVEMILLAGTQADRGSALAQVQQAWDSGRAFDHLLRWVAAQGGRLDPDRDDFGFDLAPLVADVTAERAGYVTGVQCREVGYALADLGGARRRVGEGLDLSAGVDFLVRVGEKVQRGQPLAKLYCRRTAKVLTAKERLTAAVAIAETPGAPPPLILDRIGPA